MDEAVATFFSGVVQGFATLLGAVAVMIAAWMAIRGNDQQRRADLEEQKKSVHQAIGAEISAIVRLLKEGEYAKQLAAAVPQYNYGGLPGTAHHNVIYISADRNYVRVYEANLKNIAFLGTNTLRVVEFYALVESALDTNLLLRDLAARVESGGARHPDGELAQRYMKTLATAVSSIVTNGEELSATLLS